MSITADMEYRHRNIPDIVYGTAFKFDATAGLVEAALKVGIRGVDSAAVTSGPYREKLVGDGIGTAMIASDIKRGDIWIQTKFTPFRTGKDPKNYPYDTAASIEEQVEQSINTSLENFQTNYLDCLILHDPCSTLAETLSVWKAMSQHVPHSVFHLGASNIGLSDLEAICATEVKPILVQNRFTPDSANNLSPGLPPGISTPSDAFDKAVRQHCATHDLTYQPWGVLWGNKSLIASESLGTIAELLEVSKEIAFYLCVASLLDCRVSILTGTKTFSRMKDDVDGFRDFEDVRARIMEEGGRLLACCKDLQMAIG